MGIREVDFRTIIAASVAHYAEIITESKILGPCKFGAVQDKYENDELFKWVVDCGAAALMEIQEKRKGEKADG